LEPFFSLLAVKEILPLMRLLNATNITLRLVVVAFGAIFGLVLLSACNGLTGKANKNVDRLEEARVTSPDGRFDAVMTREPIGGALGGIYWNVFIVPKDARAPKGDNNTILNASVLRGEKLIWKQNRLLEIQYDIANIEQFRNLWGSNEVRGSGWRKGDYAVEVRLAPSSPDFSFLSPNGEFKRTE
jgi:hypothetical protein